MIKLTKDQEVAVNAMVEFLRGDVYDEPFTLAGVAGAGKTFSIKEALRGRSNVVGAVISHSARLVLGESLEGVAKCITVAQLLGLTMIVKDDGEIDFKPNRNRSPEWPLPIDSAAILIIDECSMIDLSMHKMIMSMKPKDCKVIYMGDEYQLPPISSDSDSPTFKYTKARLNTAVRYSGPIADLGDRIKSEIDKINKDTDGGDGGAIPHVINSWMYELDEDGRTSRVNEDGSGYIFINDINKMIEISTSAFRNEGDPDDMRLIAYRNKTVTKLNNVIRAQTHKKDEYIIDGKLSLPEFVKGELVICDGGYNVSAMTDNGIRKFNVIYNNQTFKVKDTMKIMGPQDIPCMAMSLDPPPPLPDGTEIYVMDYNNKEGRTKYFNTTNALKARAKESSKGADWAAHYSYLANFAKFDYNYAQNAYRAQGRTYKDIIVFDNDIISVTKNKLKAKLQAMYVSCTRAKNLVFIYNKKYAVNQNELPKEIREKYGL